MSGLGRVGLSERMVRVCSKSCARRQHAGLSVRVLTTFASTLMGPVRISNRASRSREGVRSKVYSMGPLDRARGYFGPGR
jgi:hypothetical protein